MPTAPAIRSNLPEDGKDFRSYPYRNPWTRYNNYLKLHHVYPVRADGMCAGCEAPLPKRKRRWCSDACSRKAVHEFFVLKGDIGSIRAALKKRDGGICARCKQQAELWEADHIVAVVNGGGGCGLDGYQTLCIPCHKAKTREDLRARDQKGAEGGPRLVDGTPAEPGAQSSEHAPKA